MNLLRKKLLLFKVKVGMRYTTSDGYEMIRHLQTLNADGGGDCPEYALAGTLAGTRYTTNVYDE
jgi:hypothetical protein